ncbi:Acetyltransferase (GNAT) domain-containing protein [Thiothrix eikelboomii]|uniref:Acetyltransferase (GNAT) domain-containing protein n=1 Tax=Thiothrix eikelboomii TaxID=92487 RepID=A0A1T4WU87_9GAMM|nr:GNAT family N-acetyltransferase [Thiothrix eikelboomii]SKA80874.1 Acetyltransferase (GNAT) domain-containing protein [Thiothrix eikelboomii]
MAIRIKELNNSAEPSSDLGLNELNEKVFTRPAFRLALAREYKLQAIDLELAFHDQMISIPAFLKNTALGLGANTLIIGAGFDKTGEINTPTGLEYSALVSELLAQLPALNLKAQRLDWRTTQSLPCAIDHSDKVELIVDLSKTCDQRLKDFSKSTRRNIRLAFKQGFHFRIGNDLELLQAFYALYLKQMHEVGSLPHSWRFFAELHHHYQASMSLFVGYFAETPVVAALAFSSKDELYGAWMGLDPAYKKENVFLTMLWSIIEYCEQTGKPYYNLGRSSVASHAYDFKLRLADYTRPIHYYELPIPKAKSSRSPVYSSASWLIRNSPPFVMNTLSRHLLHKFY